MLALLPDDAPVCRAARKQLRQMVHDARKNTRLRLKQLEAVHNVVANHVASRNSNVQSGVVSAGAGGGGGSSSGEMGFFNYGVAADGPSQQQMHQQQRRSLQASLWSAVGALGRQHVHA
jgi:hypothetical protein